MSLARGSKGVVCYTFLARESMKAYRFVRRGFPKKEVFYGECTDLSGFTPKGEFVRERIGLPCWVLENDLMRKHTNLFGLTPKRGFVLREYGDCPLDPWKWFYVEAYRFVRLSFRMWESMQKCASLSGLPSA